MIPFYPFIFNYLIINNSNIIKCTHFLSPFTFFRLQKAAGHNLSQLLVFYHCKPENCQCQYHYAKIRQKTLKTFNLPVLVNNLWIRQNI